MVRRCCCVGLIVDPITTNHATRPSPRRRSMMPVSGLRLDAPVPIPDHVVVQHADEPVHGDAREALFVEELLFDPAEEPLCGGVVRPASLRAHRTRQIVFLADADPFRPRLPLPVVRMAGAHGPLRPDTADGRQRLFPGQRRRGGVLRTHEDGIRLSRTLGGAYPRRDARPDRRLHPLARPRAHQTAARLDESGTIPSEPGNGCVIISKKTSAAPYTLSDDGGERCGTIVKFMERSRSMK